MLHLCRVGTSPRYLPECLSRPCDVIESFVSAAIDHSPLWLCNVRVVGNRCTQKAAGASTKISMNLGCRAVHDESNMYCSRASCLKRGRVTMVEPATSRWPPRQRGNIHGREGEEEPAEGKICPPSVSFCYERQPRGSLAVRCSCGGTWGTKGALHHRSRLDNKPSMLF